MATCRFSRVQGDSAVLIRGGTGTGNELIARAIHGLSPLREGLFIVVNRWALPETLLESELFGCKASAVSDLVSTHGFLEAQAIRAALERSRFKGLATVKQLGIRRTTLFHRTKRLGISLPRQDGRSSLIP